MEIKINPRKLSVISPDQEKRLYDVIEKAGFQEADFDISEINSYSLPDDGVGPIKGALIIKNKITGAERHYQAGHMEDPVPKFEDDLAKGQI